MYGVLRIPQEASIMKRYFCVRACAATMLAVVATILLISLEQATARQAPPSVHASQAGLIRAGLTAEALAAAGLSASATEDVVDELQAYMAEHPGALESADAAYASAMHVRDSLKRTIQSGLYEQEDLTAFAAATSNYTAAQS